ncbi:hypothetical protein [Kitasatospora sp. NPDC085879]|uniref:hypothetical protein n=1 Tax=Kitasatospora sp. NPDC085879 TaxID=3154769 RepID=UPI000BB135B1|nr:hypothetical protein [Streptomyces sp. TLI_235]PBC70312.1 hypothetical protein BX265_7718 [Streptomyces sp. TLI_235]
MTDEDNDAEGRSDEGDGDRPYRPSGPYRPGPEDRFWLILLVLIVVVLGLVGLLSNGDPGLANQDGNTGWH